MQTEVVIKAEGCSFKSATSSITAELKIGGDNANLVTICNILMV